MLIDKDSELCKEGTAGFLELIVVISCFIEEIRAFQCDVITVMLP